MNPAHQLPSGWVLTTVEDLGELGEQAVLTGPFGTNLTKGDFTSSGVPVLTIGCLTEAGIDLSKSMFVREATANDLERYRLREGDFLFSRMASVGRASLVPSALKGALFNYHIMRLRLSSSAYDPNLFLAYVRGAPVAHEYIRHVNHGGTRDGINTAQLLSMPVMVPPRAEQSRIAFKLESLLARSRRAKDALDTIPGLLDQLRQSVLSAAFRGDLTISWRATHSNIRSASELLANIRTERHLLWESSTARRRPTLSSSGTTSTSNLPPLPQNWAWSTLGEISHRITDGTHQSPVFEDSGIPFLVIRNIISGKINWGSVDKWVSRSTYEQCTAGCRPTRGDILYTAVGSYGTAVAVDSDEEFMFQRHIAHIKPSPLINCEYLVAALNSPFTLSRAHAVARGNAQKTVTLGDLREFPIPIAPIEEQAAIVMSVSSALTAARRVYDNFVDTTNKLQQLEALVLNKAFRGELVPQDPNDEPASMLLERIRAEREAAASAPQQRRPSKTTGRKRDTGDRA